MAANSLRPALGARRRRFVLERPVDDPDGFGGRVRRYVDGPLLWGALSPLSRAERLRGGRSDVVATHRITIRARHGVGPPMRLKSGSRRFAIRAVADPDERGRDLVCEVEELIEANGEGSP